MNRNSASRAFWTIVATFVSASSYADEPTLSPSRDSTGERSAAISTVGEASNYEQLRGRDANNDGIRDDLTELLSSRTAPPSIESQPTVVQRELAQALARNQVTHSSAGQSRCLDYLLLEPKDRSAADRYVRSRAHGVFGTHPCDPIVSPLLERPFDTDVARLQLGPVKLEYAHYE